MRHTTLPLAVLTLTLCLPALAQRGMAPPAAEPAPEPAPPPAAVEAPKVEVKRAIRIAVRPMEASEEDKRLARVVDDALVAEMRKLKGASVIGLDEVKAMLDLEAQKQLTGCTEASCIAEIAAALGADVLIIGQIALVNGERVFGVKRIDQGTAQTVGDVNLRLVDEGGDECLASIGTTVQKLFPELPLREGETRGVSEAIALRLHPPPLAPPVPIAGMAVAGVALTVAAGALVVNQVVYHSTTAELAAVKKGEAVDGGWLNQQNLYVGVSFGVTVASAAIGVGLGAASGAAAIWLTDWGGAEQPATE
jgi:curli biogenesis system outer membrane secretion channel CsgG